MRFPDCFNSIHRLLQRLFYRFSGPYFIWLHFCRKEQINLECHLSGLPCLYFH